MNTASPSRISLSKKAEPAPVPAAATSRVDGLALVMARNEFYRTNAGRMLMIVLGQFILILSLTAVIIRLFGFTDSRDYFFSVQDDNTLILERPLSEPVFTDEQIRDWAEDAIIRTFTFGYYDHLLRLQDSRTFFTTRGWGELTKAMADAQILERMKAVRSRDIAGREMVLSSAMYGNRRAVIKKQGLSGWAYAWEVELLLYATYRNEGAESSKPWRVTIVIIRTPATESRNGIGIDQLIAVETRL